MLLNSGTKVVIVAYCSKDGMRNGVGTTLNGKKKRRVLTVKRMSDKIIWIKGNVNGETIIIISICSPLFTTQFDDFLSFVNGDMGTTLEYNICIHEKSFSLWI